MNIKKPLIGKTALVTGSASQLGTEFCKILALNGATIFITDILETKCFELKDQLNEITDIEHYAKKLDISSEHEVSELVKFMESKSFNIDILVNSACTTVFSSFTERTKEDFMKICETNIYGTFNCIQKFSKFMINTKTNGSIINIGSIYGFISGDPRIYTDSNRNTSEVYAASKSAIIQMTKYFAVHLSEHHIRVNCISPGGVFNNQGEDFVKNYSNKTPLARMANENEIANSLLFLADNTHSSYVTGHNLVIDGGFSSW